MLTSVGVGICVLRFVSGFERDMYNLEGQNVSKFTRHYLISTFGMTDDVPMKTKLPGMRNVSKNMKNDLDAVLLTRCVVVVQSKIVINLYQPHTILCGESIYGQ